MAAHFHIMKQQVIERKGKHKSTLIVYHSRKKHLLNLLARCKRTDYAKLANANIRELPAKRNAAWFAPKPECEAPGNKC